MGCGFSKGGLNTHKWSLKYNYYGIWSPQKATTPTSETQNEKKTKTGKSKTLTTRSVFDTNFLGTSENCCTFYHQKPEFLGYTIPKHNNQYAWQVLKICI